MLDDALDPVEEAWLEDVCVVVAVSELYCAGSVTTDGAIKVIVENVPSASDTVLCRVKDSVVKAIGDAADAIGRPATGAVTEVEICVFPDIREEKSEATSTVPVLLPMILIPPAYCDKWPR